MADNPNVLDKRTPGGLSDDSFRYRWVLWFFLAAALFAAVTWATEHVTRQHVVRALVVPEGPLKRSRNEHLGAENQLIAIALYERRGFSDPFPAKTGPTAWIPPMLPAIQASFFWVTGGIIEAVVVLVLVLKSFAMAFAMVVVLWIASRQGMFTPALVALALVGGNEFYAVFQNTNDCWLGVACVALILLGSVHFSQPPGGWLVGGWGLAGGLIALANPILGMTWAANTLWLWWPAPRKMLVAATLSMIVVAPWIARTAAKLGRPVPIKSNLGFELWMANVADDDGVLDLATLYGFHPFANPEELQRFVQQGELAQIDVRGAEALQAIRANPFGFVKRIMNRLTAALFYYTPFSPGEEKRVVAMALKRVVFALPAVSLILVLLIRPKPLPCELQVAIVIYGATLLPYILITYFDRYAVPLLPIKAIFVMYGLDLCRRPMHALMTRSVRGE